METKVELLSTPEGPETNGHEELKLQEFVIYSSESSSTQPQSLIQQPLLINQKNAELLNPSKLPQISVTSSSNGDNTGNPARFNLGKSLYFQLKYYLVHF